MVISKASKEKLYLVNRNSDILKTKSPYISHHKTVFGTYKLLMKNSTLNLCYCASTSLSLFSPYSLREIRERENWFLWNNHDFFVLFTFKFTNIVLNHPLELGLFEIKDISCKGVHIPYCQRKMRHLILRNWYPLKKKNKRIDA